jgi:hypothetical protein
MKMDQTTCDPTLLNRFFDEELGPDEYAPMIHHLKSCPSCQKAFRDNQSVSSLLKAGVDGALAHVSLEELEEAAVALIHRKGAPWWMRLGNLLVSRKFYVSATAMATGLVLFFALVRGPAPVPGPSALINSFEGDVASVMILETQRSHQTVLWFSENANAVGDDRSSEQNQTAL